MPLRRVQTATVTILGAQGGPEVRNAAGFAAAMDVHLKDMDGRAFLHTDPLVHCVRIHSGALCIICIIDLRLFISFT